MNWRRAVLRVVVIAANLLRAESDAGAAEPEIAFTVVDGWVELKLTQDDNPLPGAKVRVLDSRGGKFADGETGTDGSGEFPMPPGTQFRVEIKVGDRTADMILLTQVDGIVVPKSVLLSFGLTPCCRYSSRSTVATETELPATASEREFTIPRWFQAAVGIAFTILGAAILVRRERRHIRASR
ncbi:MAG: hypothetical protein U0791_20655 [Gemmataceae bacterium]